MPHPVLTAAIDRVASGEDLSVDETASVLSTIMSGDAGEVQIAAFLIALRTKAETEDELAGLARAMRQFATPVTTARDDLLDVVGTGGGRRTFNVSTTAAVIAAGAGCAVAKHGNRSATSLSGAADVLEALGARIDLSPAAVGRCIDEVGFGFLFAPTHHQATRYVIPVRRDLAVRTVFNLLGPLTNPAGARRQLVGVADGSFLERMAGAVQRLGTDRALLVSSEDGLDEMSTSGVTRVVEVGDSQERRSYRVSAADFGLAPARFEDVMGGTPADNAATARAILAGEHGAPRDLAVLNAGAAIYAAGRADSIGAGVTAAQASIDTGAAAGALERYVEITHRLGDG
ncbi:anthranilate phosphoribosyltransferase [Capillimicrobium parvum]|uniref:Anthranilate phosphoribosyltransferase n=1 Tax=Capillimicrobium parvum TaxID=2884022 RepID=A0A9E6Y0E5_9ACTN|nr:anthranilate phosphoribosyltransferase [Capillimicrobium parvum]UGS37488.1 Anthranilate phosphoribosyltransferase [Capillimicrobium parvum]